MNYKMLLISLKVNAIIIKSKVFSKTQIISPEILPLLYSVKQIQSALCCLEESSFCIVQCSQLIVTILGLFAENLSVSNLILQSLFTEVVDFSIPRFFFFIVISNSFSSLTACVYMGLIQYALSVQTDKKEERAQFECFIMSLLTGQISNAAKCTYLTPAAVLAQPCHLSCAVLSCYRKTIPTWWNVLRGYFERISLRKLLTK